MTGAGLNQMTKAERRAWRRRMRQTQRQTTLPVTTETKVIAWAMGIAFGVMVLGWTLRGCGLWGGF